MSTKFREIDRDLISGFIRLYCLRNPTCVIPNGVKYSCLLLFHGVECFKYYDKTKIRISKNNTIITNIFGNHATSYGTICIPFNSKGIHTWKIKILKHNGNEWGDIAIGIDESNHLWQNIYFCPQKGSKNYGYGSTGIKGDSNGVTKYLTTYTSNDIITMIFNLNKKELFFAKNDEKPIRAFIVNKTTYGYSLAICIMGVCDSVSLISYCWDNNNNNNNNAKTNAENKSNLPLTDSKWTYI
eukprot:396317_1